MADQALAVQITAVDRFSAMLSKFKDGLEKTGVPVEKLGKSLARLKPDGGLATVGRGLGEIRSQARGAADELGRIVPPLAAITGAASLAGMAKLVGQASEFGTRLGNQAARIGVTTGELQTFQNAARLAGVSGAAAASGFQALRDNLVNARGGLNSEFIANLRSLGGGLYEMYERGASASEMFPVLAQRIAALKDPTLAARVAVRSFGGAGEELLPLLRLSTSQLRDLREEARRHGVLTEEQVRALDDFRRAQTDVTESAEHFSQVLGARLSPALTPLLNRFSAWIDREAPHAADAIGHIAEEFAAWVNNGGLDQLEKKIEGIGSTVDGLVQATTGWDGVAELAFGALAVKRVAGFAKAIAGVRAETALLKAGLSALAADAVLSAVDPKDKLGSWIDANLPGAAWFDDWTARHTGFGRTYQEQREADPSSLAGYADMNRRTGPGGGYATDENHRPLPGAPFGATSGRVTATADRALPIEARGLLDTIAGTESPGYDVMYGGQHFTDFSRHPGAGHVITSGPNTGQTSTAAGRYQFVKGTWDAAAAATGAADFSPQSQDKAAWWLAQRDYQQRTGRDLLKDLQSGDPAMGAQIGSALRQTWTSLPGGIEAGTTRNRFAGALAANTVRERDRDVPGSDQDTPSAASPASAIQAAPLPAAPAAPVPAAPAIPVPSASAGAQGAPGPSGDVKVRIIHSGAPAGTRMTASADGNVSLSTQGLVDQAFPLFGGP